MSETREDWVEYGLEQFDILGKGNDANDANNGDRHDGWVSLARVSPTTTAIAPPAVIAEPVHQTSQALFPIPPFWFWGFAGIEATQSTQFFLINGQGSGAGANNSVPLIARKEMILRVYPKSGVFGTSPAQVTGVVSRSGEPDLAPLNGPVTVQSTSAIQRININNSLNFRITAADCVGTVTFTVKLVDSANAANFKTQNITLTFETVPQMRVHGVLIHYTGKGLNIAAPSGTDLVNTLAWPASSSSKLTTVLADLAQAVGQESGPVSTQSATSAADTSPSTRVTCGAKRKAASSSLSSKAASVIVASAPMRCSQAENSRQAPASPRTTMS